VSRAPCDELRVAEPGPASDARRHSPGPLPAEPAARRGGREGDELAIERARGGAVDGNRRLSSKQLKGLVEKAPAITNAAREWNCDVLVTGPAFKSRDKPLASDTRAPAISRA
jgi:hypothetical protein